jgi:hypothetical protein
MITPSRVADFVRRFTVVLQRNRRLRFALTRRTRRHEDTKKMRVTLKRYAGGAPALRAVQGDQIRGCKPHKDPGRLASADLIALLTPAEGPAARQQRRCDRHFFAASRLRGFAQAEGQARGPVAA